MLNNNHNETELTRRCVNLAKQQCANCENGYCLYNDCPCDRILVNDQYSIADGRIGCGWFIAVVLPLDVELNDIVTRLVFAERDLYEDEDDEEPDEAPRLKSCKDCGKLFLPNCNRQIRCIECARQAEKKANAKNHRLHYWQAKQP